MDGGRGDPSRTDSKPRRWPFRRRTFSHNRESQLADDLLLTWSAVEPTREAQFCRRVSTEFQTPNLDVSPHTDVSNRAMRMRTVAFQFGL